MTALKVRAFGQFDMIDVQVVLGNDNEMSEVKDTLNQFCNLQNECNRDVKLIDFLNKNQNSDAMISRLSAKCNMTKEQAKTLLNRIVECCNKNYVYMYTNMFSVAAI